MGGHDRGKLNTTRFVKMELASKAQNPMLTKLDHLKFKDKKVFIYETVQPLLTGLVRKTESARKCQKEEKKHRKIFSQRLTLKPHRTC